MRRYKEATGNTKVNRDLPHVFMLPALTVHGRHLGPFERR